MCTSGSPSSLQQYVDLTNSPLADVLPSGLVVLDTNGRLVACNKGATTILGIAREDLLSKSGRDFNCLDEERRALPTDELPVFRALRSGKPIEDCTLCILLENGSERWIRVNAIPLFGPALLGALTVVREVSQVEMASPSRPSTPAIPPSSRGSTPGHTAELEAILDTVADAVISILADGAIVSANRKAEELFGWAAGALVGRHYSCLLQEEKGDDDNLSLSYLASVGANKNDDGHRLVARHTGGTKFPVLMRTCTTQAGGRPLFVCMIRDLSEQENLKGQLRRARRMEAVGTLAGGLAHDFNNLLQGLTTALDLATVAAGSHSAAQIYLEEARKFVTQGAQVVRHLLAFSRRNQDDFSYFEVGPCIQDALRRVFLPPSIHLTVELDESQVFLDGSPGEIQDVLAHLLSNAVHALEGSGNIALQLTHDADERFGPRHFVLSVSDDGTGMSREVRDKCMEPFFSTRKNGEGSGLGLSVVYGIAKRHGGTVEVKSEPGQGTTVRVILPVANPRDIDFNVSSPPPSGKRSRVVVIEDEQIMTSLLSHFLTRWGYDVVLCASPEEATHYFKQSGQGVSALFCGDAEVTPAHREVALLARSLEPSIWIVTASEEPQASGIRANGPSCEVPGWADHVLSRPITPQQLMSCLSLRLDPLRERGTA